MPILRTRQPDGTWAEIPTIVGPQGKQGEPFKYEDFTAEQLQALRGKDGYTPVKGIDYVDGAKGEPGASGVYIGTGTPPDNANVWVIPTGNPTSTEDWEFDLEDGTTDTKSVVVVNSDEATANGLLGILRVKQADGSWKEIPAIVGTPGKDGVDGKDGQDGYTPIKGVDYFDGTDGVDGYTPVKGVDYFDGDKGEPGYTPVKGVDYFDGQNGKDGSNGKDGTSVTVANVSESTADGGNNVVTFSDGKTITVKNGSKGDKGDKGDSIKGDTGSPGKDGVPATHSWNGTTLTITSASGTSSADLKGEKGDKGDKGDSIKGDKGDPGTTDFNALENKPTTENWTFTLEDGTIVTKAVYVG